MRYCGQPYSKVSKQREVHVMALNLSDRYAMICFGGAAVWSAVPSESSSPCRIFKLC